MLLPHTRLWTRLCCTLAFVLPLALSASTAHAVIIDDFNGTGWGGANFTSPGTTGAISDSGGTIAGGTRTITITAIQASGMTQNVSAEILGSGQFSFAAGNSPALGTAALSYDVTGALGGSLDSLDLSFASLDFSDLTVRVTLSDGVNTDFADFTFPGAGLDTPFVENLDLTGIAVDRGALTTVTITFLPQTAQDFVVDQIEGIVSPLAGPTPVPEPTALLLWGMMGVGVCVSRGRLRNKAQN